MKNKELVLKLLKENNNVIKSKDLKKYKVNNTVLLRLEEDGLIERVANGLYINSNTIEDEYYTFQHKCPKAIFSHETALYFHELSNRTPITIMITIPSGYNTKYLTDNKYKFSYINNDLYELGKITIKTQFGNEVYCYDIERTICDIVRNKNKIEVALFTDAMQKYVRRKSNDYSKLYRYAEKFNILDEMRKYMEVLK